LKLIQPSVSDLQRLGSAVNQLRDLVPRHKVTSNF